MVHLKQYISVHIFIHSWPILQHLQYLRSYDGISGKTWIGKDLEKKWQWPKMRTYLDICLNKLVKNPNPQSEYLSMSQALKQRQPEYKSKC
jgi:hypothetical protein